MNVADSFNSTTHMCFSRREGLRSGTRDWSGASSRLCLRRRRWHANARGATLVASNDRTRNSYGRKCVEDATATRCLRYPLSDHAFEHDRSRRILEGRHPHDGQRGVARRGRAMRSSVASRRFFGVLGRIRRLKGVKGVRVCRTVQNNVCAFLSIGGVSL